MTTATKPRIATPVKRERTIISKTKTIKIGHGYYDLKLIKEIIATLPDGEVTLTSYPSKNLTKRYSYRHSYDGEPIKLECSYSRGHFTLNANNLRYYVADKGKVKIAQHLIYHQGEDQPAKTFSLLSVELPLHIFALANGLIKSEV